MLDGRGRELAEDRKELGGPEEGGGRFVAPDGFTGLVDVDGAATEDDLCST